MGKLDKFVKACDLATELEAEMVALFAEYEAMKAEMKAKIERLEVVE
jgi:hypothetical protein